MRIHNKSQACHEGLASVDENPIRPNRSFANNGADTKPTPRVMQGSALGFWGTGHFRCLWNHSGPFWIEGWPLL